MAEQFKAKLTLYRKGKKLSEFTAPDASAVAAVRWVTHNGMLDAEWADEKWAEDEDNQ